MADNKNPLFTKGLKEVYPSDNLLGVNNELATLANQYDNNFVNNLPQGQQDALNSIPNIGNAISKVTEKATKTSQDYQAKMRDIDPYGSAVNMQASLEAVDQASAQQEAMLAAQRAMLERGNAADDLNYQNDLNSLAVQKLQLQNALTGKAIGIDPKEGLYRIKNYQSSMTKDIEEAQRANEIQARMSLLEGKAQELGMRYGQQKANNALNMLKQEMAEDNLMKSKAEASEQLYNALLQQSSDDRYKGLIDNQATVDLSKKPIETDFLPSVYHGFVDSLADVPKGLGAITNAIALSPEEKQQRLEALKNLTPENAPTNWLGDSLIKLGDAMSDSDVDYQNKYNLDNMLLDADSAKGAINTALGIGKNAAGIVADTLVSAAPEILTTAISTGTIPTALRTAKIAAKAGQIAEDVGAGLAKASNVATKLEKPIAQGLSAVNEVGTATKFTAPKFSPEVFKTNLSGYVSEDVAKKVAGKLGANVTPSMAGKALRETLTKAEKLELAKVSWVKDSAKLFGGITGLSAEVTQKMHNAQIDRMKQQGIDPDKLGYLVSLNKNDIIPAMAYTALNLVEFGTLFKPLLGGKATRELVSAAKEKSLSKFFDTLKEVGKSIIGDKGATLGAAAIGALKLGGNAATEGATEFAQTVTEAMMRDNDLKGTLGDYYDAVRNVLANPKSYKEVKEAGITGAIAGAGTHVTGQIAPSVARESLSKVASLASKGVNKISEYATANKVQAQENINNVSNLNAKAENKKDVSLKELYQVAVSPKAREAFLNEPETDNNKEYKSIVEDLANINSNADTKALAEKLATKYPKYTQEQLADIIHISKNRDIKYSDADTSQLSQVTKEAIEKVTRENYDNSKVKAMFQNKPYEDLTLGERYAITPSKLVEQQSTESRPTIKVTKDNRLATSLEGVKDDTNEANTYVAPIEIETGNLKEVTEKDVNSFDTVFSEKHLVDSQGNYKNETDVKKAYRSFVTTLAIAEAGDTTQSKSIKDTYIGGLINKIRTGILLAEDPVEAYKSLAENSIEKKLVDLILKDIKEQDKSTAEVADIHLASPIIDMLTSSDIAKPEDKNVDTETLGTQGSSVTPDKQIREAITGLEQLFDSAYGTDKKTRKLRNINKMTSLGVTASKISEAIKKFKYVIALREAARDTTDIILPNGESQEVQEPLITRESLATRVLEAQKELEIAQRQTQNKLDAVNIFFKKSSDKNGSLAATLASLGVIGEDIKNYIFEANQIPGVQNTSLIVQINHNTKEISLLDNKTNIGDISKRNELLGRDKYLLYVPLNTTGVNGSYTLANSGFRLGETTADSSIALQDHLEKEVKDLKEASEALDSYVKNAIPQVEDYLDKKTLKANKDLTASLVTMVNGITKLTDDSVKNTIKDTLGRLRRANRDIAKLEHYMKQREQDKSFEGDTNWNITADGSEVTLFNISLIKAKDLMTSLLSERDNLLYNMQIFFNEQKDASDIIALVGLWNTQKLKDGELNRYMSDTLIGKAKSILRGIANFFKGTDVALKKFRALLKQVNSTRSKNDQISEKDLEDLSRIIIDKEESPEKVTNEERYEIVDTTFRLLGILTTQTENNYGFGDTDNLLSELLPSTKEILLSKGYLNLTKNLVGGYYLPSVHRISSYAMFDKSFKMNAYDVKKAFEFDKFKDAIQKAVAKTPYTTNFNNLFLDLFDIGKVENTIGNINANKDKVTNLKEAVVRSWFMSIMGLLSNEKLIAPLAKINSNLKDTEENQRVTSTYQATVIVNDMLRNFGLVEENETKSAGEMITATEQLKNMVQQILKLTFANMGDDAVVIDPKTNVIKLKDKKYLDQIQYQARAFTNRGYISPKEVAAKEQLSDVLKDLKLSQKGNKFSSETDPRVVNGIIAQSLTPLQYNLDKMNAMVEHLALNGKNLAYEVKSMLNPIFTATEFYNTGKMKLSPKLWATQVKPIVMQAAKELGVGDTDSYIQAFKEELIDIDENISKNPVAETLLASIDIPRLNNKIQSFIEVAQESNSNRGKGTQFYYNVFAGPNDRTTIDGIGHQQSNKNIRHLIQKVRDPEEAKKFFDKEFSNYVYSGNDLKTAKDKAKRNLMLALGTGLDIVDLTKLADDQYRNEVTQIVRKYSEEMQKVDTLAEKQALMQKRIKEITEVISRDKKAYQEFVDKALADNNDLANTINKLLKAIENKSTLAERISAVRNTLPEFEHIPTYSLIDALGAIEGLNAIEKGNSITDVRNALYDSLYALETLETDGQTFGPASINILNFVERASRKLALAGNLSVSEDPLMYMDDDNYNFTAQILFSEWFRPVLDKSLNDLIAEQGLSDRFKDASENAKVLIAKEALVNSLMNNVQEYTTNKDSLQTHRNLLDLVISEAIFKLKNPNELSAMLDQSMMNTLNARIKFIRALSKPILQLSGYGSGVKNNTKGFTSSFFMKNIPTIFTKIASIANTNIDKESEIDLFDENNLIVDDRLQGLLTPSEVASLRILGVKNLKDFHDLIKMNANGELDFTNLDKALDNSTKDLIGVVTQALQRVSPFQAQRTTLTMRILNDHVKHLAEEINIKLGNKGRVTYVEGNSEKAGSIDYTDVSENYLIEAIKAIQKEDSTLAGILMSDNNGSITNFVRRSTEVSEDRDTNRTSAGTTAKKTRVYFSPVDLSLVTNFGQSMDAKVQGIVQAKLADMGIFVGLNNFDAFTTSALYIRLVSELANEAFAELIMDDKANLGKTMFIAALENEKRWYKLETAPEAKSNLATTIAQIESYLMGLEVADDLRTINGVHVDNFGGNYRLDMNGNPATEVNIAPLDSNDPRYIAAMNRLYPMDGSNTQKAMEFYTTLVPTLEWLNAYKDVYEAPQNVVHLINELLKKQIALGERYSNKDILEKSKVASEAIEKFLNEKPEFKEITDFYKFMSKELSYDTFRAFEKLQDTFYTTNPTQMISLAKQELRDSSDLLKVEYGRYFAYKQKNLVTNSMNEVASKIVDPSKQSNLYVTSLNMVRNNELPEKKLEYSESEGYLLGGEPLTPNTEALLDGEVYSVTPTAYEKLKTESQDSAVVKALKHLSKVRGIQPNNIVFNTDKYKRDIEAKVIPNSGVTIKSALRDDLLGKLQSNDLKEVLKALSIMTYLRDKANAFGEAYRDGVNTVLDELNKEIADKKNTWLFPNKTKGLSSIPADNRLDAQKLLDYLNDEIVPYTIYRGYNKIDEALGNEIQVVDFTDTLPTTDTVTEEMENTQGVDTKDIKLGTQSADTTEENIRKELYKEITLENSFESLVDTFNELSDMSGLDAEHKNMYVALLNRFFTKTNGDRFFRDGLEIRVYNSTGEASGKFNPKTNKIEIFLGDQRTSIGLSPAEAYMHELIHAVTEYAIQSEEPEAVAIVKNAEAIRSQLMRYYNSNQAKLDLANRLGFTGTDSHKIDSISRIYIDYMNGSISEFIAIAMTNKEVQNDLAKLHHREAKGFIERLVRFFSRLLNALTNTPQEIDLEHNSGSQAVYQLAVRLANNNNQLQSVYKGLKYQSTLQKWLGVADSLTNKTVSQWIKNEATKLEAGNPAKNIYSLVKYLMFAPRNPVIAHKAMKLLVNDFDFSPNGFLATTLSNISTLDDAKRKVNELLAKSANLDKERLMLHTSLQKELKSKFSRDLTPTESKELGKIIQVYDLRAIDSEINRLYPTYFASKTNSQTRDRIRDEIRATLTDISKSMPSYLVSSNNNRISSILSYYDEKTQELADYISKGQISSNMLLNAYNIAQCLTLPDVVDNRLKKGNEIINQKNVAELAQKLDKLVSLRALVNASDKTLSTFRELYESDLTNAGVVNAFDMHKMSKQGLEDELLTKGVISNEVKGYVRTRTNESVDIIVAPIAEEADLRADGYKLVKNYAKVFNFGGRGLGMYISTTNMQPKFNRGVIRTTSNSSRGMTIQSAVNNMYPLETTAKKQAIVADLISKLKRDNRNQSEEFVPVFDAKGQIVDYRLLLSQKQKEELEIANTDLFDTLPNAITRYMDRVQSEAHNKEILKDLEEYYHKNKGKEEFIYIGPNGIKAHNPKVKKESDLVQLQEIWDLIPGTTKDYIQDSLQGMDQGIYVQASQFASIAGSRDFRLTDTDAFKRIVPLAYFRRLAKMMEYGIIKMGKWVTQKIVLTNPDVIIGNLASNQLVLTTFGLDPVTSMKYYAEGIQYIQAYNYLKEKEVTLKKDIELATDARKKAIAEANLLKIRNKMKSNPIYEFDARGLISDIAEDLPKTEEQQDYIDRAIEKSLNKVGVPQAFREAFDVVMVNEGTTLHSAYASLVKYSDLVARYALYKHMKLTDNLTDQDMFDLLDRAFINYTPAQHPILKYANDIGFARFTKYWLRIQSHISTDLLDKRLGSTMLLHGALKLMGIPISSPLNAIFFRKFMNYDTTFGIPGVTDIDEIYDDLADGLIITNPLVSLKKLF